MPLFTLVTTCKGRLEHLKRSLPRFLALEDCEVVVVDYDCPQHAGDWVRASHPQAIVVQARDRPTFSAARARNLGAAAGSAPWLLFLDADILADPTLIPSARSQLAPGRFLIPDPRTDETWGAIIVARDDFVQVEGYDETFEGWGSEDIDLTDRLEALDMGAGTFPGALLQPLPHDDALRTRFHTVRDRELSWTINGLYRTAKFDLRKQGVTLTPEGRALLYADVRRVLLAPRPDGAPAKLQLVFRTTGLPHVAFRASLTYEIAFASPSKDTS